MTDIDVDLFHPQKPQRLHGKPDHVAVGFFARAAEKFGPGHKGFAGRKRMQGPGVQTGCGVAEAAHPGAVQNMRVNARNLRRDVGS